MQRKYDLLVNEFMQIMVIIRDLFVPEYFFLKGFKIFINHRLIEILLNLF